jgi:hypothetical protein
MDRGGQPLCPKKKAFRNGSGRVAALFLLVAIVAFGFLTLSVWEPNGGRVQAGVDEVKSALLLCQPVVAEFGSDKCAGCREVKAIMDALTLNHRQCNAQKIMSVASRRRLSLLALSVSRACDRRPCRQQCAFDR